MRPASGPANHARVWWLILTVSQSDVAFRRMLRLLKRLKRAT